VPSTPKRWPGSSAGRAEAGHAGQLPSVDRGVTRRTEVPAGPLALMRAPGARRKRRGQIRLVLHGFSRPTAATYAAAVGPGQATRDAHATLACRSSLSRAHSRGGSSSGRRGDRRPLRRSEQPGSRRQKRSGACEPGDTSQLSASAAGRPAAAEPGHSAVSGQQPMGVGNLFAIPFGRLHDFRVPPKL
jgi:hypothetical protein